MKKPIALFLLLALMLTLCACGGSFTAIPELKLSWDMSPEEAQKASPFQTIYSTREDGYSFLSSEPGQKLPKIAGVPLHNFMCVFKNDEMIQIILFPAGSELEKGSLVLYDYQKVVELYRKEYGQPTMTRAAGPDPLDPGDRAVWILNDGAIEIQGYMRIATQIVYYAKNGEEAEPGEDAAAEATPEPTPEPTPEATPEPEQIADDEGPEARFSRILQENLLGTWISANDPGCELVFHDDATISLNGQSYALEDPDEYKEGLDYYFDVGRNYVHIGWCPEVDAICTSDLPGLEDTDFVYFYREGSRNPGEPFFGTWTLSSGNGLTWEGSVIRTITVTPEGGLLLNGRDIGMELNLFPDDPDSPLYRWVINVHGEDGSYFGAFLETKDPFADPQDSMLIIDNLGRSYYQRG